MPESIGLLNAAGEPVMRRILVVDDDPHICLAVRAWLKRYGFEVAIAVAVPLASSLSKIRRYDLLIVDTFMPGMRGFESIRGISQSCAHGTADRDLRIRILQPWRPPAPTS